MLGTLTNKNVLLWEQDRFSSAELAVTEIICLIMI